MKQLVVLMLVAALAVPALAAVSVTASDLGGQKLQIKVSTTDTSVVRGVALKLTVTGGNIAGTSAYTTPASAFNTFIDYGFSVPTGFDVNVGHPLAIATEAGVLTAFPATVFSVCAGYLDTTGAQGGLAGTDLVVATLQLSGIADNTSATVAIEADTLRGGIVGDNVGTPTVQASQTVAGPVVQTECVKTSAPFYADWVAFGKPNCWCYAKNCRGDVDGLKQGNSVTGYIYVSTNDLTPFLAAYGVKEAPKGPGVATIANGICADFDHLKQGNSVTGYIRVSTNDLTPFLAAYGVKEAPKGPGVPDCDMANYNFFVTP